MNSAKNTFYGVRFRTKKSLFFKDFVVKFWAGWTAIHAWPGANGKGAFGLV